MTNDIMFILEGKARKRAQGKDTWGKAFLEETRKLKEEQKRLKTNMAISKITTIELAKKSIMGHLEDKPKLYSTISPDANSVLGNARRSFQAEYDNSVRIANKKLTELWKALGLSGSVPKLNKKLTGWKLTFDLVTNKDFGDDFWVKLFDKEVHRAVKAFGDVEKRAIERYEADKQKRHDQKYREGHNKTWLRKMLALEYKDFIHGMKFFIKKYIERVKDAKEKIGIKKKVSYPIPYMDDDVVRWRK